MKKHILFSISAALLPLVSYSQKTAKTYYDFEQKHVHEIYATDNYGTKNGAYTEYSEYGGVLTTGTYKNDNAIGKWIYKDDKGKLSLEETWDNDGKLNGELKRYMDGYLYANENYKHGSRIGHWKTWYLTADGNGTSDAAIYLKPDGTTQLHLDEYYKTCPDRYVDGVGIVNWALDSVRKEYSQQGFLLLAQNWKNGLKEGKELVYDMNGSGTIMESTNYRHDSVYGQGKLYLNQYGKTDRLSEATYYRVYDDGETNSTINKSTDYYLSGEKMSEEVIGRNGFIGKYTEYSKSGILKVRGQYNNNGKRDSIWDFYSVNGKDSATVRYIDGQVK